MELQCGQGMDWPTCLAGNSRISPQAEQEHLQESFMSEGLVKYRQWLLETGVALKVTRNEPK